MGENNKYIRMNMSKNTIQCIKINQSITPIIKYNKELIRN
jgi:hypothetical protein